MILQSMFTKIVFGKCPVKILATRNNLSMISSYKNMSVMSAYRTRLADYKGLTFERTTNLKSHHISPSNSLTNVRKASSLCTVLAFVAMPAVKGLMILLSRTSYWWWNRLSPEAKNGYRDKARKHREGLGYVAMTGLGLFGAFLLYHLRTDPITGRTRLYVFSDQLLVELANCEVDMILDLLQKGQSLVDTKDPEYRRVTGLTRKLMAANDGVEAIQKRRWSVVVVNNSQLNAFVLPNGFIFVYTGIAELANDDQLSIIIGHEMSHCVQHHMNQTRSIEFAANLLQLIPLVVIWATLPFWQAIVAHVLSNMAMDLFVLLPYSRHLEHEADKDGLMLAAKACVDVTEGYKFWAKMAAESKESFKVKVFEVLGCLSSHPSHWSRAKHLKSLIPVATEQRQLAKCND